MAPGAEILGVGGSVVATAIAAATAICVVHADGSDFALDYREPAPDAARPERFAPNGRPEPALLRTGGLAVGVPGEAAGITMLHRRFGRLPLGRVLAPAIRLAREGFSLDATPHLRREI